jgi:tetratricopeptide (TPR) repeat protein
MLIELGRTLFERARQERGAQRRAARVALLGQARERLDQALTLDPENAAAHHNLGLVLGELGDAKGAERHLALHEKYRTDDNAIERAVTLHRSRNPAANHAAEAVAIYGLAVGDGRVAGEEGTDAGEASPPHPNPPPPGGRETGRRVGGSSNEKAAASRQDRQSGLELIGAPGG